jgi:hypothetical protein
MTDLTPLPEAFADLEPFAVEWSDFETPGERYLHRQGARMADLKAFHAAAAHRLDAIFEHLDSFPPGDLPAPEARLFRTILGLAEVMQAVEVFGQPRVKNAPYPHHVEIVWKDLAPVI